MAIFNRYKNILDNLIDSSNSKFLNQTKPIDKKSWNTFSSKNSLINLLAKVNYLNKNVTDRLLGLAPKNKN